MKSILTLSGILCLVSSFAAQAQTPAAPANVQFEVTKTSSRLDEATGEQIETVKSVKTFEVLRSGMEFSESLTLGYYLRLKVPGSFNDLWIASLDIKDLQKLKSAIESGSILKISSSGRASWTGYSGYEIPLFSLRFTRQSPSENVEAINGQDMIDLRRQSTESSIQSTEDLRGTGPIDQRP